MVRQYAVNGKDARSTRAPGAKLKRILGKIKQRRIAQSGSARALGARGRRFESCYADNGYHNDDDRKFLPKIMGCILTLLLVFGAIIIGYLLGVCSKLAEEEESS